VYSPLFLVRNRKGGHMLMLSKRTDEDNSNRFMERVQWYRRFLGFTGGSGQGFQEEIHRRST
jgi:hypothetical protein